ncbi:MAG: hypothetical protein IJQ82_14175 [Selenomonadaceae bacterium]|nr:hypothetical protein [Selenomonadaceae bacterium]
MNSVDLDAQQRFTEQARQLQAIAAELKPFLELIWELDLIGEFVNAGLLTPLYVNSDQRRFWLSEIKTIPRKSAWTI